MNITTDVNTTVDNRIYTDNQIAVYLIQHISQVLCSDIFENVQEGRGEGGVGKQVGSGFMGIT